MGGEQGPVKARKSLELCPPAATEAEDMWLREKRKCLKSAPRARATSCPQLPGAGALGLAWLGTCIRRRPLESMGQDGRSLHAKLTESKKT